MLTDEILAKYEMTVGIECHVQLATDTKLFSGADNDEREKSPNSVVSPIDYGLPGMLPVLNRKAVELAIIAGKALNSPIASVSRFDRKHYFYPDLPKGYQISQMYLPIIGAGVIDIPLEDGSSFKVRINHAHMEEDAGKLTHYADYSLVDLNRAGTPLIEIVSEPDIHSAIQAKAYVTELYRLMTYSGVTRGDLFHGNMRFDVNISAAKTGSIELGIRSEVKNLNSFRSVERAAEYEFRRQVEIIERGERVVQETRGWDDAKQKTTSQRSKEEAQDYRYMPDADIPPIVLSEAEISKIQSQTPRLPSEWRSMLVQLGLDFLQIETLLDVENEYRGKIAILESIEKSITNPKKAKFIANWNVNVFIPILREESFVVGSIDYLALESTIYDLLEQNKLSSTNAKILFKELASGVSLPDIESYATEKGYIQVSDENEIIMIVDEVLNDQAFSKAIDDLKNGNDKAIAFLIGQVMKKSNGKANPALAQKLIREKIKSI